MVIVHRSEKPKANVQLVQVPPIYRKLYQLVGWFPDKEKSQVPVWLPFRHLGESANATVCKTVISRVGTDRCLHFKLKHINVIL